MKQIKLTTKQISEIYDRLIKEKQNKGGSAIIETSPRQGIYLGNDFYRLEDLVKALNERANKKGIKFTL